VVPENDADTSVGTPRVASGNRRSLAWDCYIMIILFNWCVNVSCMPNDRLANPYIHRDVPMIDLESEAAVSCVSLFPVLRPGGSPVLVGFGSGGIASGLHGNAGGAVGSQDLSPDAVMLGNAVIEGDPRDTFSVRDAGSQSLISIE
jgi:hypothetical protein